MRKINKKFIALLMVFTSIMSFLPVGFSGQEAKADIATDASTVRVNPDGDSAPLATRTDSTIKGTIYTTENTEPAIDITVKSVSKGTADWITDSETQKASLIGVIGQKVILTSINDVNLVQSDGVTPNQTGYDLLKDMGVNVSGNEVVNGVLQNDSTLNAISIDTSTNTRIAPQQTDGINETRVGVRIQDLPAGVNKISYAVQVETVNVTYKADVDTATGQTLTTGSATAGTAVKKSTTSNITIEHGTKYAISKISSMLFKAYVGEAAAFDGNDAISDAIKNQNNATPFLYRMTATPDKNMPLRYNFDVPDSLSALKYVMTFGGFIQLSSGISLYKNGIKATQGSDYSLSGQSLTGDLTNLGKPDLIVIRVKSVTNTGSSATTNISKAYAIEINYNKLSADKDYSLSEAGITKLNYDSNSSVKAYMGKVFDVTTNSSGFNEYKGNIYIDPRAEMISLDPKLIKDKSGLGYVVTNNYVDSTGTTRSKKSELKNGRQYIDFKAGAQSNQIQIDIYTGKDGSVTDSSTILARYLLTVNQQGSNAFNMDLTFGTTGSSVVYLTQPGVKDNRIDDFTADRRTYDLYFGAPNVDTVKVTMSGSRSSLNEYIKVWLADDINTSNLTEAQESVDNVPKSTSNTTRDTSLDVNVGKSKKMVVQAYYDEFEYQTVNGVTSIKVDANGSPVYKSYPVGDKYVFYLPENYSNSDTTTPTTNSSNAALSLLKVKGYSLVDGSGNSGFSSDKYQYTATVNKDDKTANITATTKDSNAKSITATISGSTESYDLVSGQETEITLNSTGTTNVKIVVVAQDGVTTSTYNLTIKNSTKSSNVNLKNIIVNPGDYTFDAKADATKVRVDPSVTSVKITPVPEVSKSVTTVNGETYTGTAISVSIKGNQKTTITIVVTSEDGKDSKSYTVEINRVDVADWQDNNNTTDRDDQFYDEYNDTWVDLTKYEEWGTVNGKPAYFDNHNRQVKNAWITSGGKTYFLNNLGFRASGWKVDTDGKSYYLDPTSGEIRTGWINLNNSWYYLALNGVMKTGWLSLNGKWYYFTPNGQMVVNQTMYIDDKSCTFGQDGALIS